MDTGKSTTEILELVERIRYLRDVRQLSFRQIGEELGIWRGRCSKLYIDPMLIEAPKTCLLDEYRDLIVNWYKECPSLKAIQVYNRLRQRQIAVGRRTVSRYTREFRQRHGRAYFALTFHPGEEAQVDWFFFTHPILGKVAGFVLVLSYSRYCFARFFPRYSFEFFIQGHLEAFSAIGGITQALRYDNLKSVVLARTPLKYNPAFLEFARHYGFEIRLCNPGRGNEKGRVERLIRTIRDTFCNTAISEHSMVALNRALDEWCADKNRAVHRATDKVPEALKERELLKALPAERWLNCRVVPTRSSKTAFVTFDNNRYSVPDHLAGDELTLHAYCDRIEVFDGKHRRVATHPRSFAANQTIDNPTHRSFSRISAQAKRERIYAAICKLDPVMYRFLNLCENSGEDPYEAAHSLFLMLKAHSRQVLLSAVREAVQRKMPRIKFLASLLAPAAHEPEQSVLPQRHELLQLEYEPRSLEAYDRKPKS